jgi:hypothetical protein
MAETIGLEVLLAMDADQLQLELIKAENQLKKFESQLSRATDTTKIANLQKSIANVNGTINNISNAMGNTANKTGDATQSLVNLSRVAQDAPYGFIGIANNLNPLLESFQRLQKESGGSANAIKSLVSGLTGPAGIGLALGVVSSLFIKFGDDIGEFITDKLTGLGDAFNKESDLLNKGSEAYVKASTDINKLKDSFNDYQNGLITKDKFLKEFNSTLGDTIAKTEDLATAEKFLTDYADTYVQMTFKKSVANLAAAEAAKKQIELELLKNKPITPETGSYLAAIFGNPALIGLKAAEAKVALQNGLNSQIGIFEEIRKKYTEEANKIQATLAGVFGASDISRQDTKSKKQKSKLKFEDVSLYDADLEKQIREENAKMGLYQEGYKNIIGDTFGGKDKTQSKASFESGKRDLDQFFKDNEDNFKKAEEQAKNFANILATGTTNAIRGMWDAMKKGENILDALGNAFLKLAEDIGFAILKAELLAAFNVALGVGTAGASTAATGGGGLLKMLASLFGGGLAEGGIVTGPTLTMVGEGNESEAVMPLSKLSGFLTTSFNAGAMRSTGSNGGQFVLKGSDLVLALQRSNTNLNLRRGV